MLQQVSSQGLRLRLTALLVLMWRVWWISHYLTTSFALDIWQSTFHTPVVEVAIVNRIKPPKFGEIIRFVEHSPDGAARPQSTHASDCTATLRRRWCSHPPILSLRCHAAAACVLVSFKFQGCFWLIWKKNTWTKANNTGAKYVVTISLGRQWRNASTCGSLSSAYVLQQQAAAKNSNTL